MTAMVFLGLIVLFGLITAYKYFQQDHDQILERMLLEDREVLELIGQCAGGLKTKSGITLESVIEEAGINISSGSEAAVFGSIIDALGSRNDISDDGKVEIYRSYVDCIKSGADSLGN